MSDKSERKLATIRQISSLSPIEGADLIELAHIDGWQCVVKKGDFEPGKYCVYFEIDSFLPIRDEFEFLRKSCYRKLADGREGFRLKTIKLKGQISQGLALPLKVFDEIPSIVEEDADLTQILGITKFEPPIPPQLQGKVRGNFPGFLRKTNQERVQNIWRLVKDRQETFEVTVKLDGTSCTYYYRDGKFGVCSRNLDLEETEGNTLWKLARKYDIEGILRNLKEDTGFDYAIQGEAMGEGIQGNREGLIGQDFYMFDMFNITMQQYLKPVERLWHRSMFGCLKRFPNEIPHVPVLYDTFVLSSFDINQLLNMANGPSLNHPVREGLVFKSNYSELSFKVISNEFLLSEK